MRLHVVPFLLMTLAWGSPARGQVTVQVELDCWAPYPVTAGASSTAVPKFDRSTGQTWATPVVEQTSTTNTVQSLGFDFTYDALAEIHCTTILPTAYSTTGSTPQVTIVGWPINDGEWCEVDPNPPCDGCSTAFGFRVSSRSYSAGDLANAAWSTAVTGLIGSTCPWSDPIDRVRTVDVAAAAGASSWAGDDLLFIRIQRDGPDWPETTFHVAAVKLRFRLN